MAFSQERAVFVILLNMSKKNDFSDFFTKASKKKKRKVLIKIIKKAFEDQDVYNFLFKKKGL